jgi:exopolysaccharide biosynthesis polyprenyl glycosylphosphotransferase
MDTPQPVTAAHLPRWQLQLWERKTLLISGDVVLLVLSVLLSLWLGALRSDWPFSLLFLIEHSYVFVLFIGFWLVLASANDLYNFRTATDPVSAILATGRVMIQGLAVYLVVYFVSPPQSLPRHLIVFFAVVSFAATLAWRSVYALVFSGARFQRRALVVGAGWAGRAVVQAIRENLPSSYSVVGFIDDDPAKRGQTVEGVSVVGGRQDLLALLEATRASEVVLAITHDLHHELLAALLDCYEHGISVVPMNMLYEQATGRVPVEHIGDNWYVALPVTATVSPYRLLKRAIDVVLALVGLIISAPLWPVVALAIRLESPGPVLYRQQRVGQGGHPFELLKYRSMVAAAERSGAEWAAPDDPRVTRVGRILRTTHLDELPQLVNILRGEMSFIGPRPERPEFVSRLQAQIPFYRTRLAVPPGLTGWAQVRYGYGASVEDALVKLQYDLYYIKHQSLSMDLLIVFKTMGEAVRMRGR